MVSAQEATGQWKLKSVKEEKAYEASYCDAV